MILHEELSEAIIGAAIEVHRALGPGLLESAYQACLCHELALRGIRCRVQAELPLEYKDLRIERAYRIDLIVEEKIIIEVKAVEEVTPRHEAQLLTYLRLTGMRVGLILNFNHTVLHNGIVRKVL
jgi:GxxExxY protein